MRVVFMGTPSFALPSLRMLHAEHEVLAVYTQPDRPVGRGRRLSPSPVKAAALDMGIPVEQPTTLKDEGVIEYLTSLAPDVICVAAYGAILPPEVLSIPPFGCLNVHASLLPRYRGAAPIHRAVLAGDEKVGVVIMQMEEGLDTGPYTAVRTTDVDDKTVEELTAELAEAGAEALRETLDALASGEVVWTQQDHSKATYADKVTSEDVSIHPTHSVDEALRRIRASTPSAKTRISLGDTAVQVLSAERSSMDLPAGRFTTDKDGVHVGLADGAVLLTEVKPAGKKAMSGDAFVRGARSLSEGAWSTTG